MLNFLQTGLTQNVGGQGSLPSDVSSMGNSFLSELNSFFVFLFFFLIIVFLFYVYFSFVYSKIGKKAKLESPGIAWMPFFGKLAIIFEASKMHWWPFLVWVLGFTLSYLLIVIGGIIGFNALKIFFIIGLILSLVISIIVFVMGIIWHWKTYEAVNKPGWFILIPVGLFFVALLLFVVSSSNPVLIIGLVFVILSILSHIVLSGIAAWQGREHSNIQRNGF